MSKPALDDYILTKLQMVADEKLGECCFKDDLQLAINEIKRCRIAEANQNSIAEISVRTLKELQRYTAPDYPFKSAETIAEFHTLIGLALKEMGTKR